MIMDLIVWAIFGGLAGWIASLLMKTHEEQRALANIIVGIAGAIIGGMIVRTLGGSGVTGFNIQSLVVAVFGSVILLAIMRTFVRS